MIEVNLQTAYDKSLSAINSPDLTEFVKDIKSRAAAMKRVDICYVVDDGKFVCFGRPGGFGKNHTVSVKRLRGRAILHITILKPIFKRDLDESVALIREGLLESLQTYWDIVMKIDKSTRSNVLVDDVFGLHILYSDIPASKRDYVINKIEQYR